MKDKLKEMEEEIRLHVKDREEKDWREQKDLQCFGEIPEPEWFKIWPLKAKPLVTSLANGRQQKNKNIHNISRSLEEENSPKIAKKAGVTSISEYFERREILETNLSPKV